MLSDVFPTGHPATELAGVQPGDSVVVDGAGPVGLMAACAATLNGASQVMVVDTHKDRLALAEKLDAIAIDDTDGGGVDRILDLTGGKGADRRLSRLIEHDKVKPHRGSSRTSCRWPRHQAPLPASTSATQGGPWSCSSPDNSLMDHVLRVRRMTA